MSTVANSKAVTAKRALIDWLVDTEHYELIHVDLIQLRKLQSKPDCFPKVAEYEAFGSMHQPIAHS